MNSLSLRVLAALVGTASLFTSVAAHPAPTSAPATGSDGEVSFRALFKELVETNTSLSVGSCTLAAERMAARLKAAGYADADMHLFSVPEHPKDGGLVAEFKGSNAKLKPVLLLAHLDVVEAKREDWVRDPFVLVEKAGYFYGRGTSDDKAQAAIFTDLMIRLKQENFRPAHTIRLALTCGEESAGAFNGADWLAQNHKDWIDAEFAINEGGAGELDADGKPVVFAYEAAEKVYQDFVLESTNPGGHSSQPVPDNAIYEMAAALSRVAKLEFPAQLTDMTRAYFTRMSSLVGGETGAAMLAIVKDPGDAKADAIISRDKKWHSMLRTTCVATMISGGHAFNALPQRVTANINCRMYPGSRVEEIRDAIAQAVDDPKIKVTITEPRSPATPAPVLLASVSKAVDVVAAKVYPGVPVLPALTTGATDGIYTTAAGIPTYGIDGYFVDPDFGNIHGLNERIRVEQLMSARRFHYELVKMLTK